MKNNYFLVRHGKTDSNHNGIFMGILDIPLISEGIQQAVDLHEEIKKRGINFHVAYSSRLSRALYTAYLTLGMAQPNSFSYSPQEMEFDIPIIIDGRLNERNFGDLAGFPKKIYLNLPRFEKYKDRNVEKSFSDAPDGGDSFSDLEARLNSFFKEVNKTYYKKNILIFSHNGPIRVMRKYFDDLSEEETLKLSNPHCKLMEYNK